MLRKQVAMASRAMDHVRSAMTKAKEAILSTPELLELMGLTDGERRLFTVNPEYKSLDVIARFDTVLWGDDFSIVEMNAEGAFGVSYADRLTELFEGFQPMREFSRTRTVSPMYMGNALVGTILDTWHEFGGTRVPRVAVVDWTDVVTRTEFDIVCEHFQRHGVPARFVDPRELEYKDGELRANGEVIDLVYRRLLTSDVLGREDEVKPLIDAYSARVVCVVNSFRAKLFDKKVLFALMQDARIQSLYTEEESEALNRHMPWTRRVEETKTAGPDHTPIDLVPWMQEHRMDLVIKPNDEVGGRGVVIGANVEPGVWEQAIKVALVDLSVVQKRVQLPSSMFPEVGAAGELYFSRRFMELDPYLLQGGIRGMLTRLSATALCSVHTGAGTVPTFILEDV